MRAGHDELDSPRSWGELDIVNASGLALHRDGQCRSGHWGYVISGDVHVSYPDHDEVLTTGDAYYIAIGHLAVDVGEAKLVDFTPPEARPGDDVGER